MPYLYKTARVYEFVPQSAKASLDLQVETLDEFGSDNTATKIEIDVEDKIHQGLLHWHPSSSVVVLTTPGNALEGLIIFHATGYNQDQAESKAIQILAFTKRSSGQIIVYKPPEKLDGIAICKHFEGCSFRDKVGEEIRKTEELVEIIKSRR